MKSCYVTTSGLEKYEAHSEMFKEKHLRGWFYHQWQRYTNADRNRFICLEWGMKQIIWGTLSYLLRHVALTVSCCDISFGIHKQLESLSLLHTPILYAPTSPLCLPVFSHIQAAFICFLPCRPSVWRCKQNKEHQYKVRCSFAAGLLPSTNTIGMNQLYLFTKWWHLNKNWCILLISVPLINVFLTSYRPSTAYTYHDKVNKEAFVDWCFSLKNVSVNWWPSPKCVFDRRGYHRHFKTSH